MTLKEFTWKKLVFSLHSLHQTVRKPLPERDKRTVKNKYNVTELRR
jgi:hypothetical protein